jgi:hypothetical protein
VLKRNSSTIRDRSGTTPPPVEVHANCINMDPRFDQRLPPIHEFMRDSATDVVPKVGRPA